ncbi:MAG: Gfo/Idh/MocA family oxidoreductase [Nitrososphaerota archaeon]|jgi:predicted dehydrogenase|nr:Gfo/Idh/MocA family oxidoreductase [Nitrososphaerota archaeon]MDG6947254.1 Gfo/Idh/MocA family oxidoreductase [Nitrososphaerota archaeon]MDG6955313.1 Gfo/Idh/MocA family oxidoreductase [Nitrososphaerota archaeon]
MLKAAIIGCGGISWAHARGYEALKGRVEVTAVADVRKDAAEKLGASLGGEAYTDYEKMLRDADVDFVDICLPHKLHKPVILKALAAGKHAMCEKPMCLTVKDADEIVEAVRKSGKKFMPAHNQLFAPALQEAKRLIGEGLIGKIHFIRTQDCFRNNGISGWRTNRDEMGGGELIDTGYHPNYMMNYFAPAPVAQVFAMGGRYRVTMDGEDTGFVALKFQDGSMGNILSSWAFPVPSGGYIFSVTGERGELLGTHNLLVLKALGMSDARREWPNAKDTFIAEIEHFAECLDTGREPLQTASDGRDVVRLITAEYESMATGRAVSYGGSAGRQSASHEVVARA